MLTITTNHSRVRTAPRRRLGHREPTNQRRGKRSVIFQKGLWSRKSSFDRSSSTTPPPPPPQSPVFRARHNTNQETISGKATAATTDRPTAAAAAPVTTVAALNVFAQPKHVHSLILFYKQTNTTTTTTTRLYNNNTGQQTTKKPTQQRNPKTKKITASQKARAPTSRQPLNAVGGQAPTDSVRRALGTTTMSKCARSKPTNPPQRYVRTFSLARVRTPTNQ